MRADNEQTANSTNKRGIIVDRDPAKMRIKVRFDDEDGMVSAWIDVVAKSTKTTQTFMMPDIGEEVWCAMDAKGEDGCLIGSKYNDTTTPPHSSNEDIGLVWADGYFHLNTGTGALTLVTSGPVKIIAASIEFESATLTHNGIDISDKHSHSGVLSGPSNTGPPV